MDDLISRQAAIDALWKALFEYEDKAEKQFQESDELDELDVGDWIVHRIFVQNMSDIDRKTILQLPAAQKKGHWIHQTNFGRIECDQCGKVFRNAFSPKNFCPNCGSYNGGEA